MSPLDHKQNLRPQTLRQQTILLCYYYAVDNVTSAANLLLH